MKRIRLSQIKNKDETLDTFYNGCILVLQKKKGYRFSLDAPLLADFIQPRKSDNLLELGTGSGIISLLLSRKNFKKIIAVEIQRSLVDLARRNVKINNQEGRISIVEDDICIFQARKKFDIIYSNPPYIQKNKGHLSVSEEKSIAKHELKCDIFDIMQKTSELLKKDGKACFVFPQRRREDLMKAAGTSGLRIKAIRFIFPHKNSDPNLFLTECNFSSKEKVLLPPLILYDEKGNYTSEVLEIFSGRRHA